MVVAIDWIFSLQIDMTVVTCSLLDYPAIIPVVWDRGTLIKDCVQISQEAQDRNPAILDRDAIASMMMAALLMVSSDLPAYIKSLKH